MFNNLTTFYRHQITNNDQRIYDGHYFELLDVATTNNSIGYMLHVVIVELRLDDCCSAESE